LQVGIHTKYLIKCLASPKHSKVHKRSTSQKLSNASSGQKGEHSIESCYSSSQSQTTTATAGVYATTPTPTKNLESKREHSLQSVNNPYLVKLVKKAINRKESSLKRKVNKAQRKEKRATKTLGIVVGIFLVCWLPFFTINILNAICIKINEPSCQLGFSAFFYSVGLRLWDERLTLLNLDMAWIHEFVRQPNIVSIWRAFQYKNKFFVGTQSSTRSSDGPLNH
jgi:hypothetical protein